MVNYRQRSRATGALVVDAGEPALPGVSPEAGSAAFIPALPA